MLALGAFSIFSRPAHAQQEVDPDHFDQPIAASSNIRDVKMEVHHKAPAVKAPLEQAGDECTFARGTSAAEHPRCLETMTFSTTEPWPLGMRRRPRDSSRRALQWPGLRLCGLCCCAESRNKPCVPALRLDKLRIDRKEGKNRVGSVATHLLQEFDDRFSLNDCTLFSEDKQP